jgi:hypothetical protein
LDHNIDGTFDWAQQCSVLPLILLDNEVKFRFVVTPLDMDVFCETWSPFQDEMVHKVKVSIVEREIFPDEGFWLASPCTRNVLVGWKWIKAGSPCSARQDRLSKLPKSEVGE